ncbi:formate dehydrogenase subunit delta [Azohydromonas caseinilytica]|uniref:Formate dehydrogenase subunit delta n=1 Tax=Azohydromonas caseinilytica TaxID=2728836 RepID=A0A848FJ69_9BURK|nr:formate dehydrogenase subunit delta [Azohydromonas caseinilytica]NML17871.1 formate dehydrogenase subunit delta [Azohydromonas caseinilytica]
MKTERLIRMANGIGDFFVAMPEAEEARRDLALHIRRYWEPRMRRSLYQHLDAAQGAGLSEIVLQALRQYRAELA